MPSAAPPPPPPNAEVAQVEELRAELEAQRTRRSEALRRLKQCSEKVAEGTPADSKVFRLYQKEDEEAPASPDSSATMRAVPDPAERIEMREERLAQAKKARRNGVAALKRTTMAAIQTVRETTLLSPEELRARLEGEQGGPATNGA